MATRISRDFDFLAGVHFEGHYLMNQYSITLTMEVQTDSIKEQNIAMERMKYFVHDILDSVVFVSESEKSAIDKYTSAGLKVSVLPEEPYDQIITLLLLYKLNAICEEKLIVTNIQLDSLLSDGVGFMNDIDDLDIPHPFKQGWWIDNSTIITNKIPTNKKEKIVKLVKKTDWASLGLDWQSKEPTHTEIIFTPESEK